VQRLLRFLVFASACATLAAAAQTPPPEVTLTRLDCGNGFNDQRRFSDTFLYDNPHVRFTFSCYLIKHGGDYMVWDTGFVPGSNPNAPKVSLVEQLAQLHVTPQQVKYVGISHFHQDHTGQLFAVPGATLLVGERDWAGVTSTPPMQGANVAGFAH
jgi:glyoxylase-like metal-dependent hydrolase (beta-lactamase superfamily II)